jgi:hypothetical protein
MARLVLNQRNRVSIHFLGAGKMAKVETFAFAIGFVLTGILTFAALPLA